MNMVFDKNIVKLSFDFGIITISDTNYETLCKQREQANEMKKKYLRGRKTFTVCNQNSV